MPKKKMKRANGEGSVISLSGNRRKPFTPRVTISKKNEKQLQKNIAYYTVESDAEDALAMYQLYRNKKMSLEQIKESDIVLYNGIIKHCQPQNHSNVLSSSATFYDIYNLLYEKELSKLPNKGVNYNSWFKYFKSIHDRKINSLLDIEEWNDIFYEIALIYSESTLRSAKTLVKRVFEYATIRGVIKKYENLSEYIKIPKIDKKDRIVKENKKGRKTREERPPTPFTDEEIFILFKDNTKASKKVLHMIFTGTRTSEYLLMKKENIHIKEICTDDGNTRIVSYMVGGSKTDAGRDRIIPIHPYIEDSIIEAMETGSNNFLGSKYDGRQAYEHFIADEFEPLMTRLGMNHMSYDARHTFATLAKRYKVDEYIRKRIIGHKLKNLTDDTYTHIVINQLYQEILKINLPIMEDFFVTYLLLTKRFLPIQVKFI